MLEKVDIEKPRRNLLIVSCVLIFVELAGIKVTAVSVPGLSTTVQRPELIVPFIWLIFVYSLWRFWLLSKPAFRPFRERANQYVNRCRYIRITLKRHHFDVDKDDLTNGNHPQILRGVFRREAQFFKQDDFGQFGVEHRVRLNYCMLFMSELAGDIRSLPGDPAFIEHDLPIWIACIPIALLTLNLLPILQRWVSGVL